jgi:hypothetical protein
VSVGVRLRLSVTLKVGERGEEGGGVEAEAEAKAEAEGEGEGEAKGDVKVTTEGDGGR